MYILLIKTLINSILLSRKVIDIMTRITIDGNKILTGEVKISGAKNSAVALVPMAIFIHWLSDALLGLNILEGLSFI